jgi:hypothetical protein
LSESETIDNERNTMITMQSLNKRNDVLNVTKQIVRQSVRVVYIKGMEKRLTTKDHTAQAHWLMFQLVSLVSQQIVNGNLNVLNRFHL